MEIPLKLRQNYVRRRQEDILSCETALKNKDFKTIETVGHQMKGNGLSFGYENIAKIGEQMEAAARAQDENKLESLLGKFSEVVTQITPE
jgi:HPt (histidine-containing phosphotransfer) domain-containing protein